jgi:hypothetical protein
MDAGSVGPLFYVLYKTCQAVCRSGQAVARAAPVTAGEVANCGAPGALAVVHPRFLDDKKPAMGGLWQ